MNRIVTNFTSKGHSIYLSFDFNNSIMKPKARNCNFPLLVSVVLSPYIRKGVKDMETEESSP